MEIHTLCALYALCALCALCAIWVPCSDILVVNQKGVVAGCGPAPRERPESAPGAARLLDDFQDLLGERIAFPPSKTDRRGCSSGGTPGDHPGGIPPGMPQGVPLTKVSVFGRVGLQGGSVRCGGRGAVLGRRPPPALEGPLGIPWTVLEGFT